jgi:hypothetical protein
VTCKHCGGEIYEVHSMGLVHSDTGMALCPLDVLEDDDGEPIERTRAEV